MNDHGASEAVVELRVRIGSLLAVLRECENRAAHCLNDFPGTPEPVRQELAMIRDRAGQARMDVQ